MPLDATLRGVLAVLRDGLGTDPARRWQGTGLVSSAAAANPITTLALGLSDEGVVVWYTYNGDANLDGRINADDYFAIDSGFLDSPANPLYTNGDFNYDGRINADDYFLIDTAFLGQGAPLAGLGVTAAAAVAVPEPGLLTTTLSVAGYAALRRGSRRA